MNLKTIFLALGFTLVLAGCGATTTEFVAPARDTTTVEMVLGSDPATFDFGTISMREGLVRQAYRIKNSSGEARILTKIQTSCMCTEAKIDGQTFGMHGTGAADILISDGETTEMVVVFDPNAHGPSGTGPITRVVDILSDHPTYPQTTIRFKGNVIN